MCLSLQGPGAHWSGFINPNVVNSVMETTREELRLLKPCDEEPNSAAKIAKLLGKPAGEIKRLLADLAAKGLVYHDKHIDIWSSTLQGVKHLKSQRNRQK